MLLTTQTTTDERKNIFSSLIIETQDYIVRLALNKEDVMSVISLRNDVFNRETKDIFDDVCHHLMIISKRTFQTIGTYRIQTYEMAAQNFGFYSSQFFNLNDIFAPVLSLAVEVGRACVAREYRHSRSLFLLWKGLAKYLVLNKKQYLFGCSSLLTQEIEQAACAYHYFESSQLMHPSILVYPHPQFHCEITTAPLNAVNVIPNLLQAYLRIGAKICSLPAIDRQFGTIDFLNLLNVAELNQKYYQIFLGKDEGCMTS